MAVLLHSAPFNLWIYRALWPSRVDHFLRGRQLDFLIQSLCFELILMNIIKTGLLKVIHYRSRYDAEFLFLHSLREKEKNAKLLSLGNIEVLNWWNIVLIFSWKVALNFFCIQKQSVSICDMYRILKPWQETHTHTLHKHGVVYVHVSRWSWLSPGPILQVLCVTYLCRQMCLPGK